MGKYMFDQFSLLHFSVGVVVYFWGMDFTLWVIIHAVFELIENTDSGVKFIDDKLTFWPGGKKSPDLFINMTGDQISAMSGFLFAQMVDRYGKKYGLVDMTLHSEQNV